MARLGDYVRIRTGKLDANASSENGQYPFFTCAVEPLKIDSYSYDCECVLVAGNGDLNVKYYDGKFDAYQRTYIIESLEKDVLSVPYLYCFLDKYVEELRKQAIGGVIKYIKLGNLTEAQIPVCSIESQEEIVANFDRVNNLISLRKQQLAKLDELVKSRFIELFGDPVQNPMEWETVLLKSATSKIGSGATPKGGKESYQTEGITLIRSMNVHDGRFEYKDLAHITDEQAKQLENVTVEENDVFINITGASVARSCIVPKHILPARVNQHVAIIRCITSMLNPVFANQMFLNTSFKGQLLDIGESGGATRQAITKQQLETLMVILPPLELQKQFATFVEQTDKSKLAIQQSLDKLEMLKKSLMQEYFG
jgi:type I restriction enzyme S subunit